MTVSTVIVDRAYSGKDNLIYAKKNNINVISKLNLIINQGTRKTEDQLALEETLEFKQEAKHRYKIEDKNAEFKNAHGYDTALSYGLSSMHSYFCSKLKKNTQSNAIKDKKLDFVFEEGRLKTFKH